MEALRSLSTIHQRAGHSVEVASLDDPADPEVQSFPLPLHALGPATGGTYQYAPQAVRWLRRHRADYDALIVHGLWQYHSFAVWRACARTTTPYYVFPHGMLDPWFRRQFPLKHLKKALYWPWGDYRVLRDARAVLFTCEEERLLAPQSFSRYRANAVVVGLGTAEPPSANASLFLERFPQARDRRLLLFLGRLHPKKGCDLLLEAFARVLASDPSWLLVFAGPDDAGWQASLLQRTAELGITDRVLWTGMLRDQMKWSAFAAAEVFALPSHQENFGIAVAEALACGLPVLISRAVNIWREIEEEHAGLAAPDTLQGTEDLLAGWLQLSAGEQQGMRANARRCFVHHFDIQQSAARLLRLLEEAQQEPAQRATTSG